VVRGLTTVGELLITLPDALPAQSIPDIFAACYPHQYDIDLGGVWDVGAVVRNKQGARPKLGSLFLLLFATSRGLATAAD
jgi:hypothetical protein